MFTATVYAEGNLSYIDEQRGIINFTDNIDVSDFNLETADKYVTYKVVNSNGEICNFGQVILDETGTIDFSFRIKGATGQYTLLLSNRKIPQKSYTINHTNYIYADFIDIRDTDGSEVEKYECLLDFLKESGAMFGLDVKALELLDAPKTLPGDGTTPQEIVVNTFAKAEINSAEDLVKISSDAVFNGMTISDLLFVTEKSADDIISYIINDVNSVDEKNAMFDKNRTKVFINKLTAEEQKTIADGIRGSKFTKVQKDKFEVEILKTLINSFKYQADMEQVILDENNIWGFSEADIAKYKSSDKKLVQIAMQQAISSVSSVEAYAALLGTYSARYSTSTDKKGGGGSGGGSGGIAARPVTDGSGKEIAAYKLTGEKIFQEKEPEAIPIETVSVNFTDLGGYEWAETAVNSLVKNYIVNGVTNTEYAPARTITREEFVKMLTAGLRLTGAEAKVSFKDVHDNDWFYAAVGAAERIGIVNGNSDGNFGVGENITREDAAVMIARAAAVKDIKLEEENEIVFNDYGDIAGYARDGVSMLANAGIINGDDTGDFAPKNNLTRAEAAKLLYGFFCAIGMIK